MSALTKTLAEYGALRQLKHNDGSDGFVFAYDKAITDRYIAELRAALESHQGVAVPAEHIVPDWPPCNPGCDYEDPHGRMHDERNAQCVCAAALASIARQRAAAPQPPTVKEAAPAAATLSDEQITAMASNHGVIAFHEDQRLISFARALLAAAGNSQGLEGWKLVPLEPTTEMATAGFSTACSHACIAAYQAMVAAAPSAPVGGSHG